MKHISKITALILTGTLAAAALTGCSYTAIHDGVVNGYNSIQNGVVNGYTSFQDGIVDSWNDMVDGFVADAPNYGLEAPSSSSQSE